jgi:hypothetical protein
MADWSISNPDPGWGTPAKALSSIEDRRQFGYNYGIQVQAGSRKRLA